MSEELKLCPFCEVEAEAVERLGGYGTVYHCPLCAITQHRLEKWQSRPIEDALQAKLDVAVEALKEIRQELYPISHGQGTRIDYAYGCSDEALKRLEE